MFANIRRAHDRPCWGVFIRAVTAPVRSEIHYCGQPVFTAEHTGVPRVTGCSQCRRLIQHSGFVAVGDVGYLDPPDVVNALSELRDDIAMLGSYGIAGEPDLEPWMAGLADAMLCRVEAPDNRIARRSIDSTITQSLTLGA
ncbi:hypothetical protein C27AD_03647 [Salinisphaera hydrothermalis C27AD]